MPELPDIEVYRRNLIPRLVGHRVVDAWAHRAKRTPPESALKKALQGATLTDIARDGKTMRFIFDNGTALVVHLMLNGEFHIRETAEKLGAKSISILFDEVGYFAVSDFQGLATIKLNAPPSTVHDALDPAFDLKTFKKALDQHASRPIKSVLIDQQVVQGIGNKYSDEILWLAKVAPQSEAGKIPDPVVEDLFAAIKKVLPEASKRIYEAHPGAINGKMRDGLRVHRQEKTPSGHPVTILEVGGRQAHYSPDEQTDYK